MTLKLMNIIKVINEYSGEKILTFIGILESIAHI